MKSLHQLQKNLEFLSFALAVLSFLFSACSSTSGKYKEYCPAPEEIKSNALKIEPCEWKDIENPYADFEFTEKISEEQLEKDLDMLCYLLKTTYAGYEKACERGLDLEILKENVRNHFEGKEIAVGELFEVLKNELSGKIQDTHFSINLNYWVWHFCDDYIVYWSDIFVKKSGNSFEVSEVGENSAKIGIKVGSKYEGDTENLFNYSAKGEEIYRIGEISKARLPSYSQMFKKSDDKINIFPTQEKSLAVPIGGKTHEILVKSEIPIDLRQTVRYGEKETEDSAYISLSHFMPPEYDSVYRKGTDRNFDRFMKAGSKFQNKKNIIVDLRSNGGGSDSYATVFFTLLYMPESEKLSDKELELNAYGLWEKIHKDSGLPIFPDIISPATVQIEMIQYEKFYRGTEEYKMGLEYFKDWNSEQKKSPCRIVYDKMARINKKSISSKDTIAVPEKSRFSGKLIIIIDRNSASATESFVANAKKIFGAKAIILGENSSGCIEYGNVHPYRLPESKIEFCISATEFKNYYSTFQNWHGEGFGFYPDVWSCGADLLETLVNLTGDNSLREEISNIEWALQ